MAILLQRFVSSGPGKPDAEIPLDRLNCLIRGPSDTGKSYIRACLWYLLGGDKQPKRVPEDAGYDTLTLEFTAHGDAYSIARAIAGGSAHITRRTVGEGASVNVEEDVGELLVKLSGAAGKLILRSAAKKGPLTGGDLRHWFLLSQTDMIAEHPTTGAAFVDKPQRAAAFYVFLTGLDDTAVVLARSQAEKDSISGQILAAEQAIKRAESGIPPKLEKFEVVEALERVDLTLNELTRQYEARAEQLKSLRADMGSTATELRMEETKRLQSQVLVQRFDLLDQKYESDVHRLGATDEGIAYFEALSPVPCPLCGTPLEEQVNSNDLRPSAPGKYRAAVQAEVAKIKALKVGLQEARVHELERYGDSSNRETELRQALKNLELRERNALTGVRVEFSSSPKDLALRRGELSSQLNLFEDIERLKAEIEHLKSLKSTKATPVSRVAHSASEELGEIAHQLLKTWGFVDVHSVWLDIAECDLVINGRPRLTYGAGRRAVFLTALAVSLLQHSTLHGFPHVGFVLLDSPLKAYADPDTRDESDVPLATVRDGFYSWLANWSGPGQVIVLENEKVGEPAVATKLKGVEFTGRPGDGRSGFYPVLGDIGHDMA